jgi:hypothetical protein
MGECERIKRVGLEVTGDKKVEGPSIHSSIHKSFFWISFERETVRGYPSASKTVKK